MKMTFRKRIILICAFWSLLFVCCGSVVFVVQNQQTKVQDELKHSEATVKNFTDLMQIVINMETGIRGYLLSADDAYLEPFNQNEARFEQVAREALALFEHDKDQAEAIEKMKKFKNDWITGPAVEEMMARKKLTRGMITPEEFTAIFKASKGKEYTDGIRSVVDESLKYESARVARLRDDHHKAATLVKNSILYGIPFSVIIGLILMIFTINHVNLTLQNLAISLSKTAHSMDEASSTMDASGEKLNRATSGVSNSTQTTASAIAEIKSMTNSNVATAQHSLTTVDQCLKSSLDGENAVGAVEDSIGEIDACGRRIVGWVSENNTKLSSITQMMAEIQAKTKVIHDIVFQTKLLSFNASVEAARAGEHGKGFSVVASEIGVLAGISGTAAKEIETLLNGSTVEVQKIIQDSTKSMEQIARDIQSKIADGMEKSKLSGRKLSEIKEQVTTVKSSMQGIAAASHEQATGIAEVSNAMVSIEEATHSQTTLFSQYNETANRLKVLSETMDQRIAELSVMFGVKDELIHPKQEESSDEEEQNTRPSKTLAAA